jgi:hypothetical protein
MDRQNEGIQCMFVLCIYAIAHTNPGPLQCLNQQKRTGVPSSTTTNPHAASTENSTPCSLNTSLTSRK